MSLVLQEIKMYCTSILIFSVSDVAPWYKRAVYWVCGVEGLSNDSGKGENKQQVVTELDMNINENPCHSTLVNVAAMTLMVATAFVWGYYA